MPLNADSREELQGASDWVASFLANHPPELGPPSPLSAPPIPSPLRFEPRSEASAGNLTIEMIELARSRPIRAAWQGRFHSCKLGRTLRWRSQLLYELFCQWEVDRGVADFDFRPVRLRLNTGSRAAAYTPDALVSTGGSTWFIEVAWASQLSEAKLERWTRFGRAAAAEGYGFELLTEAQIRHEPKFSNCRRIVRAIPSENPAPQVVRDVVALLSDGPRTAAELLTRTDLALKDLMRLVLMGHLSFDLEQPFAPTTLISKTGLAP